MIDHQVIYILLIKGADRASENMAADSEFSEIKLL